MITILKASAGSGKTFSLAREYIKLLFDRAADQYAYRHILAVTFTNKATDEMKSRILKELYILAFKREQSKYFEEISAFRPDLAPERISGRSRQFLCNILNDYGAFSVSTIDGFFQRTLKAFSREIGQFSSYQVELDKTSLVNESVDRILDSLTEKDGKLLDWLAGSVQDQLISSGRFSIEKQLGETAVALRSEEHRDIVERLNIDESTACSRETLMRMREGCRKIIKDYVSAVRNGADAVLSILDKSGVCPEQFSYGFMKAVRAYADVNDRDEIKRPSASFMAKAADSSKWFSKASAGLLPLVETVLAEPLEHFCSLFDRPYREYSTALTLKGQIYALGIAGELDAAFNDLMKEKNVLSLDDSNTILQKIIDGSDAPFIYEKIGVRYDHFLLDEFQDTSNIQWENFRPLVDESNSRGGSNLIVGDVKQSIYRWRNSDWNLLNTRLKEEFPDSQEHVLDSNWRSVRNVVEFNNAFYQYAAGCLDDPAGTLASIYSDVRQKAMYDGSRPGNVDVVFCPKAAGRDVVMDAVISEVARLVADGASFSDIGILVRTNKAGGKIASALLENHIPVISDDSLSVKSSPVVRRLTALLSYADNPDDKLNSFLAGELEIGETRECHSLMDLCEYFLRKIKAVPDDGLIGEIAYIQAFMDIVQDWTRINGNSIRGFLSYWDSVDPKISSPEGADAVKIMTVHKSKGLELNYVIFPYSEMVELYSEGYHWCKPDAEGSEIQKFAQGVYRVNLSVKVENTFFSDAYLMERKMQTVDALNTYYVATTRAKNGMTVISKMPSDRCVNAAKKAVEGSGAGYAFTDMSQILYWYVHVPSSGSLFKPVSGASGHSAESSSPGAEASVSGIGASADAEALCSQCGDVSSNEVSSGIERFRLGEVYRFNAEKNEAAGQTAVSSDDTSSVSESSSLKDKNTGVEISSAAIRQFSSWPIGGRLKFGPENNDFFASEDPAPGDSFRVRGIVLHDIMSRVISPDDLEPAVAAAFEAGKIEQRDCPKIIKMLGSRIFSVAKRGWFRDEDSRILNETSIIDSDGEIYRPDRVVARGNSVKIVDYKFGHPGPERKAEYERQVSNYARLYREMGYDVLSASLWYVYQNKVEDVEGKSE